MSSRNEALRERNYAAFFGFLRLARPRLIMGLRGRGAKVVPDERPGDLPRGLTSAAGVPIC